MTEPYPALTLFFGQALYAVATLVRFFRFYTSLGMARPPFAVELALTHCLGATLGYFFGVLWYELAVLLFFAFLKRNALVAAFAALLLLRGLDAICLLFLSLYAASYESMRPMLFCLNALLLGIGFFFVSFIPILKRVEKKMLEFPRDVVGILPVIKSLYNVRRQIALLSWNRPGSLSILIILTLGGWLMEWLAFFCLRPAGDQALADMLGRVMGSFHFIAEYNAGNALEALQPGLWGLLALLAAVILLPRAAKLRSVWRAQI
jgi:hypothetical protein